MHNPLDVLAAHDTEKARDRGNEPMKRGVFRASSVGNQPRRLALEYRDDIRAELLDARAIRIFRLGDVIEEDVRTGLRTVWPMPRFKMPFDNPHSCSDGSRCWTIREECRKARALNGEFPEDWRTTICEDCLALAETEWEEHILAPRGEGRGTWVVRGHPDGFFAEGIDYQERRLLMPVVLEIKSMSSFGFSRFKRGEIDDRYVAQAQMNMLGMGAQHMYFIAVKKETGAIAEQLIHASEAHQEALVDKLRRVALAVEADLHPLTQMPPCEGKDYGEQQGKTGNPLRWGCSYCPYHKHCYPNHVKYVDGAKIVAKHESAVPDDALVVTLGVNVDKRPSWLSGSQVTKQVD